MRVIECAAVAAALMLSGTAYAQAGGSPAPPPSPGTAMSPNPDMMRGPDERWADFNKLRDDVAAGPVKSSRPVPVKPEDVTVGKEVRDSKGVVLGAIDRVGMDYAVIASPGGKIEIEFASLAKNNKGLLINMPKAKFDAIVAGNAKPKK
ncbi:MAG: hypothetical protein J7500_13615 [Sphingomonas sp.]|uniref:hypothetical protein n=1 Tax=Sphingomonas sp. TaxID=28214 RepID=UPI001B009CDC|nr:hypothetical protein [Sphingomonas sp.]MBO9623739.1 hypothetical protein [Sphingomonas sp.]